MRTTHGLEAARTGLLPLDVMLSRMRGDPMPNGRMATDEQFQAAVAAAPFMHPRLSAVAVKEGERSRPAACPASARRAAHLLRRLEDLVLARAPGD